MELWTNVSWAVVASGIGKPLSLDLATKERRRLSYARVCVEMNVDSSILADITINLRGEEFLVTITYEWKPRKCNLCCSFGHINGTCPRSVENKVIRKEVKSKVTPIKEVVPLSEDYGDVVLESFEACGG